MWLATIWNVKYLIFFPGYILSQAVTPCHTNLEKSMSLKRFLKIISASPWLKRLELNVILTEEIVQKSKIFVQTEYNGNFLKNQKECYCVISVRIRSFFGSYFPAFGLNTKRYTLFFYISNTFFIKQMLSNALRLNFWYLKIIHIFHRRYHPRIIGHILRNKQKN